MGPTQTCSIPIVVTATALILNLWKRTGQAFALVLCLLALASAPALAQKAGSKAPAKPTPGQETKKNQPAMMDAAVASQPLADPGYWFVVVDEEDRAADGAIRSLSRQPGLKVRNLEAGLYALFTEDTDQSRRLPAAYPELTFLTYRQLSLVKVAIQKNAALDLSKISEIMAKAQ